MSKYLDKTNKINECGTQLAEALGVVCGNVYNKKRNNILRKYKRFNMVIIAIILNSRPTSVCITIKIRKLRSFKIFKL